MKTKERIVDEALTLFSVKGYKGTSVKNIADAVGIKDSSLYKHFKSKEDILNAILTRLYEHIERQTKDFGLPADDNYSEAVSYYANFDADTLSDMSKKIFLFYLKDDLLSKFWRMGNMEQFQNGQVNKLFRDFFFEDGIRYQTALFAEMSKQHIFCDADPEIMAMSFYTPIFFLLSKYAVQPELSNEALEILDRQVREFYRIYRR